ncbi:hypothetical protein DUI87_16190 [Hirundo rustica rustica]|uniref:Uncharacterized protein n=1 Tax=Hirundo rustica rustica TaxID=333673 RepID=A0A3M0K614_HIRRU|nr:hypothetical protein DUI87_16190 [Hirundo rustica rustica]
MRTCEQNSPANTKDGKEGGRDSPGTGVEIPLQPMLQTVVQQVFPLKPVEDHGVVEFHLQPIENAMLYQVNCYNGSQWLEKFREEKKENEKTLPPEEMFVDGK